MMNFQKNRLLGLVLFSAGMFGFVSNSSAAISTGDWVKLTRDTSSPALSSSQYAQNSTNTADSFRTAGSNPGGEFRIDKDSNGLLAGVTLVDTFKSFCLETNEFISLGTFYYVSGIDDHAIKGGVGGGNPDLLSDATKWLYSAYRLSSLDSAVAGFVYSTNAAANALQNAIWNLEDEGVSVGTSGLAFDLKTWALAQGAFTNGGANGTVKVMNIQNGEGGTNMQSQLFFVQPPHVEVPEPASLAIWSALAGMGLVVRRLRRRHA